MTNTYKLAKTGRYLMITLAVIFFLTFWLPVIFTSGLDGLPIGAWIFLSIISGVSVWLIYGAIFSKITTSPEGIERVSMGIRVKATWDRVQEIVIADNGSVNLVFKNPIHNNQLANTQHRLVGDAKIIQLSPFIEDVATSSLLQDIAKYVSDSNISAVLIQQKPGPQTYQKAIVIGAYYFSCFIVWLLFAIAFQNRIEDYLATLGLHNTELILTFAGLSLVIGLFVNTISLLQSYSAKFAKLDEYEITHQARTYYLIPFVIMVIGFIVGLVIWYFTQKPFELEIPLMFLIGAVSLPVSRRIERLLFRDKVQ